METGSYYKNLRFMKISKKCLQCSQNRSILFYVVGMWHSLVARIVRDDEAAGSNPVIPTIHRQRKSKHFACSFFIVFIYIFRKFLYDK